MGLNEFMSIAYEDIGWMAEALLEDGEGELILRYHEDWGVEETVMADFVKANGLAKGFWVNASKLS